MYESEYQPTLAVKPFSARSGASDVAGRVESILARDLGYSDRFRMLERLPSSLTGEAGVDYSLWDDLGVVWLVSGEVEPAEDGRHLLEVAVHDVVYGEARERARFLLPPVDDPDFRMAVHAVSDRVVEWVFDEPGMAASRIVFSLGRGEGSERTQELYVVDSDGENLRRLTDFGSITLSPAWSPDGGRVAYTSFKSGQARLYEMEVATGRERALEPGIGGQHYTPTYHPSGERIAFSVTGERRTGIFEWNVERGCCLANLAGGRWDDLSPTYSPRGNRFAFNSNRLGTATPQIYVAPTAGGDADLLSPYAYAAGGYYTSPDWSPTGDRVAFHGRVRRGRYQILVADLEDRGRRLRQLTWEGNNEDPSWAPDGRHLVFVGERSDGTGLYVVDGATGRLRALLTGMRVRVPEWSGSLAPDGLETTTRTRENR